jgi:hypothetical protein
LQKSDAVNSTTKRYYSQLYYDRYALEGYELDIAIQRAFRELGLGPYIRNDYRVFFVDPTAIDISTHNRGGTTAVNRFKLLGEIPLSTEENYFVPTAIRRKLGGIVRCVPMAKILFLYIL